MFKNLLILGKEFSPRANGGKGDDESSLKEIVE